jgi:hypothetical protein
MAKQAKAPPQPTFATIPPFYGDEETGEPDKPSPYDLEDWDVMNAAVTGVAAYTGWQKIQHDPTEAEARATYAEHVARHLVGVFPNARVSVEAYATAAGEELAGYSADILKGIGQRARRTLKTLPPIAQLVEWAEAESRKRTRQLVAYEAALERHADHLALGRQQAERIALKIGQAELHPELTADAIQRVFRFITLHPMGIKSPHRRDHPWRVADALNQALDQGSRDAAALALGALNGAAREDAITDDEWRETRPQREAARRALVMDIAARLGLPWPANEPAP